jgi:hypothetical protein
MSFIGIVLCLGLIFLCSRQSFNDYFRFRDKLALAMIFIFLVGYLAAITLAAWLLCKHHRLVCPACGRSLMFQLDSIKNTRKCESCNAEVICDG